MCKHRQLHHQTTKEKATTNRFLTDLSYMLHPLYVCLDLLHDPRLPLHLLRVPSSFIDPLSQSLYVLLSIQQVRVVWVVLWSVFQ